MAIESNTDRLMSDINVTPLVDVMLVLLIIFMITAPMMVQGVDVALPEATVKSKPLVAEKDTLIISIDEKQQVYINDFAVELDYLSDKIVPHLKNQPDRQVYFRGDRSVPYGTAVRVLAEIKNAGVTKIGMITIPIEKDAKKKDQR